MGRVKSRTGDAEVESKEWTSFLDGFSRQHEGWLASIEVATPGGRLIEVVNRPLRGVSMDHADGRQRAYVEVGDTPDHSLTHVIESPRRIIFKRSETGAHEGLEIESTGGSTTMVHFRSAMLPEMIDDIVP